MKRIISIIAILTIAGFTSFAKGPVAKGKTYCCLGSFVIEKAVSPIVLNGQELESYVVSYENSDVTVKVGIDRSDKDCTTYLVHSDQLTLQYDCNSSFFGVNKLKKKYRKAGFEGSDRMLNREEYFHQKIITRLKKSDIENIKLISVYYPRLVNDYEKVFAVK